MNKTTNVTLQSEDEHERVQTYADDKLCSTLYISLSLVFLIVFHHSTGKTQKCEDRCQDPRMTECREEPSNELHTHVRATCVHMCRPVWYVQRNF